MKNVLLICLGFLLVQCATIPIEKGGHTDRGVWQGVVSSTDEKNNRKWVNVVWASDSKEQNTRIDVTAVMDIPVATYLQNQEGSHLWLYRSKEHYFSRSPEKLFTRLTKLTIDPRIFYSLLGVPRSPGSQWKCNDKEAKFYCQSSQFATQFMVNHRRRDHRLIKIENGSKTLKIKLSRSKVQLDKISFKELDLSHFKTVEI